MSTSADYQIPEFHMGHRMRLVLHDRGYSVQEAADHLEVSRNTITNWFEGHNRPRARDLKAFCLWLRIPQQWLETGQAPHGAGPDDGLPQMDSNHQPFVLRVA